MSSTYKSHKTNHIARITPDLYGKIYMYSILEYMEDNNLSDQSAPTDTKGTNSKSNTIGFLSTN